MTTENKYPDFCVANYSPEHFKATKKVLADCGIALRYMMPKESYEQHDPDNPKGIRVKGNVATVCVTDGGFVQAKAGTPLTIKTRNIYRHVGKLNIFDSAELIDYSPNTKSIELKPVVEYNPFSVKTSLFKKFLITLKAIINHFR
ncbi:hypothetical protein GGJFMLOI_00031 [Acinetobacter phage Ab124]|uniref:Uncharacterized protein n=4 Tax=Friunavirus TaxID=1985711 RepID=A0A240EX03_9CAUD|nr:hypothetical protein AU093_gp40 [Acinetobacter phage vB_AbaP_PD-AB9]YP_009190487.1 hypothetical protein AU094_gp28 [Acinetobacter phage vB_AbaP_PD-6A3]YP_009598250.1 hypothetical protein FDH22_gp27 [Acinetobacter phage SH-Ab 15519]YP_009949026.1 hypothetical protein HOS49_gp15 [Acinetobacter phage SWH-Ab-1]YP_009949073.1 hypothetical protein HOS36_gp14 [Acinetobacter phage SWH-Ab-3]QMP19150.1 hypothetical protein GGJFMLOI_00031 [Acinetobacter phage Ab124]WPF70323.1 hypothetical protein [Ac